MQILLQVLNTEPGTEAAKPAIKGETLLAAVGDGDFAAFLENSDATGEGTLPEPDADAIRPEVSLSKDVAPRQTSLVPDQPPRAQPLNAPVSAVPVAPVEVAPTPPPSALSKETPIASLPDRAKPIADLPDSPPRIRREAPDNVQPLRVDRLRAGLPANSTQAPGEDPVQKVPQRPARVDINAPSEPRVAGQPIRDAKEARPPTPTPASAAPDAPPPRGTLDEALLRGLPDEAPRITRPDRGEVERVLPVAKSVTAPVPKPAETPAPAAPAAPLRDVAEAAPGRAPDAERQPTSDAAPLPPRDRGPEAPTRSAPPLVPVASDRQNQPRLSRLASREAAPEVRLTAVAPQAAQNAPPPSGEAVQVTMIPQDRLPATPQFGREVAAFRDEGPVHLGSVETTESRRAPDTPAPRIEVQARPVITQLVQAARSAIDGMIEVKLSPEELGRVRLAMTSGETGMTVQVTAERAETLDLLRRNIDLFAADLAEQGFSDLSFSFGQEGARDRDAASGEHPSDDAAPSQTLMARQQVPEASLAEGRLDIRL